MGVFPIFTDLGTRGEKERFGVDISSYPISPGWNFVSTAPGYGDGGFFFNASGLQYGDLEIPGIGWGGWLGVLFPLPPPLPGIHLPFLHSVLLTPPRPIILAARRSALHYCMLRCDMQRLI